MLNRTKGKADTIGWSTSFGDVFSVSVAYALAVGRVEERSWPRWKLTWNLRVQHKMKTFAWYLARDKMLTNTIDGEET